MLKLHFITNGKMEINLDNLTFGKHITDPLDNIKSFMCTDKEIDMYADDISKFTDWGVIELVPSSKKQAVINVSVDIDQWAHVGTNQIMIEQDGQIIFNDNFQSGLKGPIGNPKRTKSYPILLSK